MNFVLWPFLYLGFAAVHWFFGQYLAFFGSAPSVMFAATVACAIICSPVHAMIFGFLAGLFADFMAIHLFGGYALLFVLTAYLIWFAKTRIDFETPPTQFLLGAALTLLYMLGYMAEGALFLDRAFPVSWRMLLLTPVYNGLLCVVAFPFFLLFRPARRVSSGSLLGR